MQTIHRWLMTAAAAVLITPAVAQTPVPQPPAIKPAAPPTMQLPWLQGVTVTPAAVGAGNKATATVTLLRTALNDVKIALQVQPGRLDESGVTVSNDGVVVLPAALTIPKGKDRASVSIDTVASGKWSGTRSYTLEARYGSEVARVSFTVSYPRP